MSFHKRQVTTHLVFKLYQSGGIDSVENWITSADSLVIENRPDSIAMTVYRFLVDGKKEEANDFLAGSTKELTRLNTQAQALMRSMNRADQDSQSFLMDELAVVDKKLSKYL